MVRDLYGAQRKLWKTLHNQKKEVSEYIEIKSIPITNERIISDTDFRT